MKRALALATVLSLSCGGGGGGDDTQCQTADCMIAGRAIVKWTFDHYPEWLFDSDTCIDVGATTVHVVATNTADATITQAIDAPCGDGQGTLQGLPAGTYNVAVTPLAADGSAIVNGPAMGMIVAAAEGQSTTTSVNVPYTAWTQTYTGTLLFQLNWGGMTCALATPPVAKQTLKLTAGGQVVTAQLTDLGQKVDGTDPQPCRASTGFAQFVTMLPFGPATLLVIGTDAANTVRFSHQFDTFVGAGKNNPTITYNDPSPDAPPADAGVDAPPDAM